MVQLSFHTDRRGRWGCPNQNTGLVWVSRLHQDLAAENIAAAVLLCVPVFSSAFAMVSQNDNFQGQQNILLGCQGMWGGGYLLFVQSTSPFLECEFPAFRHNMSSCNRLALYNAVFSLPALP